jgi:hypothetical protein
MLVLYYIVNFARCEVRDWFFLALLRKYAVKASQEGLQLLLRLVAAEVVGL